MSNLYPLDPTMPWQSFTREEEPAKEEGEGASDAEEPIFDEAAFKNEAEKIYEADQAEIRRKQFLKRQKQKEKAERKRARRQKKGRPEKLTFIDELILKFGLPGYKAAFIKMKSAESARAGHTLTPGERRDMAEKEYASMRQREAIQEAAMKHLVREHPLPRQKKRFSLKALFSRRRERQRGRKRS